MMVWRIFWRLILRQMINTAYQESLLNLIHFYGLSLSKLFFLKLITCVRNCIAI